MLYFFLDMYLKLCSYVFNGTGINLQTRLPFPPIGLLAFLQHLPRCELPSVVLLWLVLKWLHSSRVLCRSGCFKLIVFIIERRVQWLLPLEAPSSQPCSPRVCPWLHAPSPNVLQVPWHASGWTSSAAVSSQEGKTDRLCSGNCSIKCLFLSVEFTSI